MFYFERNRCTLNYTLVGEGLLLNLIRDAIFDLNSIHLLQHRFCGDHKEDDRVEGVDEIVAGVVKVSFFIIYYFINLYLIHGLPPVS